MGVGVSPISKRVGLHADVGVERALEVGRMSKALVLALAAGLSLAAATTPVSAYGGDTPDFEFMAPGGTVPDEGIGVFPLFMMPHVNFIQSLELEINDLSHESAGDLDIYLINPFGRFIEIMTDRGGMNPISNADLIFNDAETTIPGTPIASTGRYQPEGLFNNTDLGLETYVTKNGGTDAWLLLVIDDAFGDTGSVGSYTLRGTVPEPMTLSLLGLGALAAVRRKRR